MVSDATPPARRAIVLAILWSCSNASRSTPAHAGTIRHDMPDAAYTDLAALPEFAPTGMLLTGGGGGVCTGNLLGPHWVLTAAHCVAQEDLATTRFIIGGIEYQAEEWLPHADWVNTEDNPNDLGLLRLSAAVTHVPPATLHREPLGLGSVVTIVGFGRTGTGLAGEAAGTEGTKRAGQNTLDATGPALGYPDTYILADFDDPRDPAASSWGSPLPLPLEYAAATGDSGGGVYVNVDGAQRLAAILSFGEDGPVGDTGTANASYADLDGYLQLSPFTPWIDDQTAAIYWAGPGGGGDPASFHSPSNWADGIAPASGHIAVFARPGRTHSVILGADTVNRRLRIRAGDVRLDLAGHAYHLTDASAEPSLVIARHAGDVASLTITGGALRAVSGVIAEHEGSAGQLIVQSPQASLTVDDVLAVGGSLTARGGDGTLILRDGAAANVGTLLIRRRALVRVDDSATLNVTGAVDGAGELLVAGDVSAASILNHNLDITSTGTVTLRPRGGSAAGRNQLQSLTIAPGGRLDLADNDLLIESTPATLADELAETITLLRAARNDDNAAPWTAPGLTSSAAAANDHATLAVGLTGDANILIKYTWNGDANLDGQVDLDDYFAVDFNFLAQPADPTFFHGDFNYDGLINLDDYFLVDAAFLAQASSPTITSIPEPGLAMLLTTACLAMTRRCRLAARGQCGWTSAG